MIHVMASLSPIEVRNLKFDLSEVPQHWHPDGAGPSCFWDELSVFFPVGEAFFVKSVRYFLPQLTDEALKADVAAFAAQEGIHAREHVAYNQRLAKWYPVDTLEKIFPKGLLGLAARLLTKKQQLGITAALEHFTSLMGEHILGNPRLLEGVHPQMAALWRWHAAEETEHRSVAFDVYRAVGGSYFSRVYTMVLVTYFFWLAAFLCTTVFMAKSGTLFSPRHWWRLVYNLFVAPDALLPAVVRPYLSYFRPSFHPAERRSDELLEHWKRTSPAPV